MYRSTNIYEYIYIYIHTYFQHLCNADKVKEYDQKHCIIPPAERKLL